MDNTFRLFYFVVLAGNCKIEPIGDDIYSMEYRVANQDRTTHGYIKFNLQEEFKVIEGLETFKWFISEYFIK